MFKKKIALLLTLLIVVFIPVSAYAKTNVNTVDVEAHYSHPDTGEIVDSGGEDSSTLGQSMCEGALYNKGLFETGSSSYATVRIVLMDAVEDVSFYVDDAPVDVQVTQEGIDSEGRTYSDFRFKDSDINNIIKCKMFVEPMGRDVAFFITLSNPQEGNSEFKVVESAATDELSEARLSAKSEIEALSEITSAQKDELFTQLENATSEKDIKACLADAKKLDADAAGENALGEARVEALNKIDEMDIDADKKAELKDKVKAATSKEEIDKILNGGSSNSLVPIVAGVLVAVVAGSVVYKKKKATDNVEE